MTEVVDHLRSFLGEPSVTDRAALDRQGRSIGLLHFADQPCSGATTVVTHGLSHLPHHRLDEELLLACWADELSADVVLIVEFVARQLAQGRDPLLYGDVIGPAGPLTEKSTMEALYVCQPTYFPEGFSGFPSADGHRTRIRWLVPIHSSEARLIERRGAKHFEDLVVRQDPDLLSLERPAIEDVS